MARKSEIFRTFDELKLKNGSVKKKCECKYLKEGDVIAYVESTANKWVGGGGYVPCSQEYDGHRVLIIILKEKSNGK